MSLYEPPGHCTAVSLVDPDGHMYPALQLRHLDQPDALKVPAAHCSTTPLVAPAVGHTYPALQLVQPPLPTVLYWPAGHSAAVLEVDAGRQ